MGTIYGVDANTMRGKAILELLRGRYNEERFEMTGNILEREESEVTMTCSLTGGRFLQSDSYSGPLQRPIIHAKASVDMADGVIAGMVASLGFLPGESPSFDYYHNVSDEDMKTLIDSGLYSNPKFEAIFDKLLQDETFDLAKTMTYYHIEFEDEDGMPVPIIIADVEDLDIEDIKKGADLRLDTFSDVIKSIADVVKQMEKAGVVDNVLGDEYDNDVIVSVTGDLANETILDEKEVVAETINAEKEEAKEADKIIDVGERLEEGDLFGESNEETLIAEIKRQREREEAKRAEEQARVERERQEKEDARALEAMLGAELSDDYENEPVVDLSGVSDGDMIADDLEDDLEV